MHRITHNEAAMIQRRLIGVAMQVAQCERGITRLNQVTTKPDAAIVRDRIGDYCRQHDMSASVTAEAINAGLGHLTQGKTATVAVMRGKWLADGSRIEAAFGELA